VFGLGDRAVRIVLPKGRYVIQKRSGTRGAALDVVLRGGSTRVLSPDEFRSFSGEALALKGGLVVRPWSLEAEVGFLAGREVDVGGEVGIRLAHRDTWGYAVGPLAGVSRWVTPFNTVTEESLGGELSVDRFFPISSAALVRVGVDVRGEWIWQSLRRADADRAALAGFAAATHDAGAAWGGGAHLGGRLWLAPSLYLDLGGRVLALGAKTTSGVDARILGGAFAGVGFAL
jgi:hypothetical protein